MKNNYYHTTHGRLPITNWVCAVLAIAGLCLCMGWAANRIYNGVLFNQNCGGYLKRAADANVINMAKVELNRALVYIEAKGLTNGYTSVFFRTPDEDLEFWYQNIKSALTELNTLGEDTSTLEKSNALIKLRETLLDHRDGADSLTVPAGISIFPNNVFYAIVGYIPLFLMIPGICRLIWKGLITS